MALTRHPLVLIQLASRPIRSIVAVAVAVGVVAVAVVVTVAGDALAALLVAGAEQLIRLTFRELAADVTGVGLAEAVDVAERRDLKQDGFVADGLEDVVLDLRVAVD